MRASRLKIPVLQPALDQNVAPFACVGKISTFDTVFSDVILRPFLMLATHSVIPSAKHSSACFVSR